MGAERVLQTIAVVACLAASATVSAAAPRLHERVAVIDLGAGSGAAGGDASDAARQLATAVVAAGLDPVIGDSVEDALAGRDVDRDAVELAAAIASAQRAFGELKCSDVTTAAHQAIGIAAARQAAGRPAPELVRGWTYLLLCADRENRIDVALTAASRLRALGGSPDVPAGVWAKYPEIDVVANRELVDVELTTEVTGAEIWIDFRRAGSSPLHVALPAGEHVIAAAAGTQRGWVAGTAVKSQRSVRVPLTDPSGPWSEVARRVAGWNGAVPPASELAWVLARVHARVALVRHGDTVEAWGQLGRAESPHRLGSDDGVAPLGEASRVLAAIADRVRTWDGHAPDPDQPLLTEDTAPAAAGGRRTDAGDKPTKWWVYAAIAGAVAVGATIIYVHDSGSDRQRVELSYP